MGTPEFSVKILEVLFKSKFDIACVYTQPPKKSERGQKINESQVHLAAKKLNLQRIFKCACFVTAKVERGSSDPKINNE